MNEVAPLYNRAIGMNPAGAFRYPWDLVGCQIRLSEVRIIRGEKSPVGYLVQFTRVSTAPVLNGFPMWTVVPTMIGFQASLLALHLRGTHGLWKFTGDESPLMFARKGDAYVVI